jgi:ABC-type polysaccharide/polyol phosphate export permease
MSCITGHSNLVKKVFFPRLVLPTASTLANLVNFLLSLIVQFVLLFILLSLRGAAPAASAWALPLVIGLHTLFNLSLALLLAAANVYFRDTQHLVGLFLSAWFFVSPVMYNLSFMKTFAENRPMLMHLYMLNPLAGILTAYRALILPGEAFPWSNWSVAGLLWPLALFVLAVAVFQRAQRNFSDLL